MSEAPVLATVKKPKVKKSEALWMMTFSDLSFILMCFFALLLSMSTLNTQKFDQVKEGFDKAKHKKTRNLSKIEELINREIKKKKIGHLVGAKLDADGLAVEFKSGMLFRPGSAQIDHRFDKLSKQIISIIAQAPKKYQLSIEGHTDDTGSEQSNWNLSSQRGIAMLNRFKSRGVILNKMSVVAFGPSQPKVPIEGLNGDALRRARDANRRVVIRLR